MFAITHASRFTPHVLKPEYPVPMQPVLKLQGLQALAAETVEVFTFNENPFFVTQLHLGTLAFRNIAHFAFEMAAATGAFFGLVLWHMLPVKG